MSEFNFNELKERVSALQREANSMECPDCGGVHHCRLSATSGNILVQFDREFAVCLAGGIVLLSTKG